MATREISTKLMNRMWDMYNTVQASDCAHIGQNQVKTQYSKPGRNLKRKSQGKQPAEFNAVETLVDFKAAMRDHKFDEAVHFYFQLRRALNWEG